MPFTDFPLETLRDYRATDPEPADFMPFWQETLEESRRLPLDAGFEPVDAGLPLVDVFDVTYAGFGGHPIKGWFMRPRRRERRLDAGGEVHRLQRRPRVSA